MAALKREGVRDGEGCGNANSVSPFPLRETPSERTDRCFSPDGKRTSENNAGEDGPRCTVGGSTRKQPTEDSESLDSCIQSTLSSVYAPFGVTASTVLLQLFSVVERQYGGDGLRCLIDFLLPATKILHTIQRESCLRFKGLLLYHEGWPLCIHEKIVLQLAPLHKVRLRQGDFYLQLVPLGRKAAKLVIKCLARSGRALAEITVPEGMYPRVFTTDFLQDVTRERNLHPLQNCLLSTGAAVYRTPWRNVVNPVCVRNANEGIMQPGALSIGHLGTCSTHGSTGTLDSRRSSRDSLASQGADSTASEPFLSRRPSESDTYTNTGTLPTEEKSLRPSIDVEGGSRRGGNSKCLSFSTDLSTPRRRQTRDSAAFETRRLFRKSYMEALQNPMNLGSSSESVPEEGSEPAVEAETRPRCDSDTHPARRGSLQRRLSPLLPLQRSIRSERRSKSLERSGKSAVKGHRTRSSSGEGSPKKLMNGCAIRFGRLDLEMAFYSTERRGSKGDSGLPGSPSISESRRSSSAGEDSPKVSTRSASILAPPPVAPPSPVVSPPLAAPPTGCSAPLTLLLTQLNTELLTSGAVSLPGNRDRSGRSVLQVCMRNRVWTDERFTSRELTSLLCYYCSTLRKEKRDLGLTVLVDSRRQQASPVLFSALSQLQASLPNALYSVLLLSDKEASVKPERDFSIPCEVLTSLKALLKHIDSSQLTRDLDGTFPYDHNHYIQFRQKMEQFCSSCSAAISSLQRSIDVLNSSSSLDTVKDVSETISQQRNLMKCVLEDSQLNRLRLEGGTFLARVRKEETNETESYRDAVDAAYTLYNQLDEEVHKLVILSNKSLHELENLLELRTFQEETERISRWFSLEAETHLAPLDSLSFTLSSLQEMRRRLEQFTEEAALQQKQAAALTQDPRRLSASTLLELKQHMSSVLQQAHTRRTELDILINLYEFYDSAQQWMTHCEDYFQSLNMDENITSFSPEVLQTLQDYHKEATKFSLENFSSLNDTVATLDSPRQLQHWNHIWMKCQETRKHLEEVLERAEVVQEDPVSDSSLTADLTSDLSETREIPAICADLQCAESRSSLPEIKHTFDFEDEKPHSAGPFSKNDSTFKSFLFPSERGKLSPSPLDDTDSDCTIDSSYSCHSEPVARHRRPPLKKMMKKTVSSELSGHHGYLGVYIRGLELSNSICGEKKPQRPHVKSPVLARTRSLPSPSISQGRQGDSETKRQSSKIQHIMDEMISTEREYVRSLSYIMEHYFPELERPDLPQDLRGKRSIIFGNLEKLCDFHNQYFLKDLEQCTHSPLSVSACFLRHEDQFGMYALYSKNKPRSDALLTSHGNAFFKNKQMELEDKMDLASYLLKPIQRMSKYALLLKDLIKECGQSQEQELADLKTAEEMVKFQLRHGNDLLAMDAIRGCDVNLKEQGQLRCQDEFIVWCGRRKYLRHVFLFEDLILFSKTKKIEGGYDIYIYKQSFKTAEIGMTENVGDSGLRFEIWFRRRKSQDTFILQASSAESKAAWTSIIGKILWRQALRNRELRMQEMVSMGIGNKPFMDIKPSDAAISDRAVDYIMKGTESRTRSTISASSYDHSSPFKRPHSTISNSSSSSSSSHSSSSFLSSLNLPLFSSALHPPFAHWHYDCIEEDELEHDAATQPSMITEGSESSSHSCSSDGVNSVSSVSALSVPCHSSLIMDSFSSESSFLCSSSVSSSPSHRFHKEHNDTNSFITANTPCRAVCFGISTLV
ncbi:pleckstrin homology domain-containing family G member 4B isoform X3 [Hemibagrus wyckioides]|uniref:pleckstrin homology domain-containing family G member 4B isoform X3 n=1 Tax=Hemibagrus wyckioides TaxID=337641 RepID=UPI00266BAC09|nr:pleckstrin homology domain-containing family G member 4B isoform X3 [Hemibagrus wyckioides]